MCADLGALGMCTMDCQFSSCPQGSDCATLGDGRKLCLLRCSGKSCDQDPLLTCTVPSSGDLGYQAPSGNVSQGATYCAPAPCTSSDDRCQPTGTCVTTTGVGHCVRR
jgi:hypothetical protein